MAARIITIAQQKGGAGKTTLTAQLAVAWSSEARRVGVIDIDPQGSLAQWFMLRESVLGKGKAGFSVAAVSGWRLGGEIEKLSRDCDIILIDSPPHAQTDAKAAIRAAHLVVVPVQASPLDVWATKPTLDLAANERVATLVVLNRFSPKALTAGSSIAAIGELGHPLAAARLGNRGSFAASIAAGRGIGETAPGTVGAREIAKLAREIEVYAAKTGTSRR